jgi:hypothetical protein
MVVGPLVPSPSDPLELGANRLGIPDLLEDPIGRLSEQHTPYLLQGRTLVAVAAGLLQDDLRRALKG